MYGLSERLRHNMAIPQCVRLLLVDIWITSSSDCHRKAVEHALQVFLRTQIFISFGEIPRSEYLDCMVHVYLTLSETVFQVFRSCFPSGYSSVCSSTSCDSNIGLSSVLLI